MRLNRKNRATKRKKEFDFREKDQQMQRTRCDCANIRKIMVVMERSWRCEERREEAEIGGRM